jgi:ribosomal protein L11 methylase PrmA
MSGPRLGSSFRDPDGFLYTHHGTLLRQIQPSYAADWSRLHDSGLLAALHRDGLLVGHREVGMEQAHDASAFRVIAPERIPFISYPQEWSPAQLRAAALLTLRIMRQALAHGMILKDASAYNVQFIGSRPVLIDTLSFRAYRDGEPWLAYRQFCQHFLAPLALMCRVDPRTRELLRGHLDGIPLDLASTMLPWRSRFVSGELIHVHLHGRSIAREAARTPGTVAQVRPVPRRQLDSLVTHLESTVSDLHWRPDRTEWGNYVSEHTYTSEGQHLKEATVAAWCASSRAQVTIDLGANTGHYSAMAVAAGSYTVAIDGDVGAVEQAFRAAEQDASTSLLPLWIDLGNPTPALGWAHQERDALLARTPVDLVLALALVHHLCISNNVPLPHLVAWLARLARRAVVEWVPRDDPQTLRLLQTRPAAFPEYSEDNFVRACEAHFTVEERVAIPGGSRALYLLTAR